MKISLSLLATGGLSLALMGSANAHITMTYPMPRTMKDTGQKGDPPCGVMGAKNPNKFRPGETIVVKWTETISHVGHFRVAFDEDGMDFPAPMARKDTNTTLPIFLDGLFEKTKTGPKGPHEQSITFPNKPCANCMLQIIQVMAVDPPYQSTAGSDVYYQCADIVLEGEPMGGGGDGGTTPGADAGAGSGGAGGSSASGGSSGSSGGSTGSGGSTASGGSTGSGGSGTSGGSTGSGGSSTASGGSTGGGSSGGSPGSGSGGSKPSTSPADDSSTPSSGCAVGGDQTSAPLAGLGLLTGLAALVLRRRRRG